MCMYITSKKKKGATCVSIHVHVCMRVHRHTVQYHTVYTGIDVGGQHYYMYACVHMHAVSHTRFYNVHVHVHVGCKMHSDFEA